MSFSSRFGGGLLASLESEGSEDAAAVVVDPIEAEDADNVEAALTEVVETEAEVAETTDVVDAVAADADTLEAVADKLEETEQEGGADPVVAEVAEIAVEAIYKRLGVKRPPMHSMEAFGDKASRVSATQLSVEGIRETAQQAWKAIVALFKRIKDGIVNFFKALFVATERTAARAKKLAALAKDAKGAPKEAEISGKFVTTLSNGAKFDKAYALASVAGLVEFSNDVGEISTSLKAAAENTFKLFTSKEAMDSFRTTDASNISELPEPAKKMFGLVDDESTFWGAMSNKQIGNTTIGVRVPRKEKTGAEAMAAIAKAQVRAVAVSKESPGKDAKAEALSASEVTTICDQVAKGMEAFAKQKTKLNDLVKELDKGIAEMTKASAEAMKNEETAKRAQVTTKAAQGIGRLISGVSTSGTKIGVTVAQAGLDYAQKSLKNLGVEVAGDTAGDAKTAEPAAAAA